jgi:hypothetical protein
LWGSPGVAGGVDGAYGSVQLLVTGQCKGELVDGSVWRSYCWVVRFKEKRKSKAEGVAASLRFWRRRRWRG